MIMDTTKIPTNTITRDIKDLAEPTGNIYESVAILYKRANQIAVEMKNDLSKKLQEFASYNDNLEEVFENREQIEISRYYEKLPKPTLIATQEYIEGKVYYRNPAKEKEKLLEALNGSILKVQRLIVATSVAKWETSLLVNEDIV